MSYDTFKLERCWAKLHEGSVYTSVDREQKRQLALIYQWVKTGYIGRKEFLTLILGVVSGDIEIKYGSHAYE